MSDNVNMKQDDTERTARTQPRRSVTEFTMANFYYFEAQTPQMSKLLLNESERVFIYQTV